MSAHEYLLGLKPRYHLWIPSYPLMMCRVLLATMIYIMSILHIAGKPVTVLLLSAIAESAPHFYYNPALLVSDVLA